MENSCHVNCQICLDLALLDSSPDVVSSDLLTFILVALIQFILCSEEEKRDKEFDKSVGV